MIYFLRSTSGGPIKIGTSIRLSERLKQLVAEHGELTVLAVTDGSYPEEKSLHQRFGHLRTVGEWFEPGDDLLGFIVVEARAWDGSDDDPDQTKPVRLDLEPGVHRLLRLIADGSNMSMAAYARQAIEDHLKSEAKRRGIKG